jgi:hypothetical protein
MLRLSADLHWQMYLAIGIADADELHDHILIRKVLGVHVAAPQACHKDAELLVLLHLRPHVSHLRRHVGHADRLGGCWRYP